MSDQVQDLLARCARLCRDHGIARSALSRELFNRGSRLNEIESGRSTITIDVLERAKRRLSEMEAQRLEGAA